MDRWVVNASPIICLAKAGYVDLLLRLSTEIVVPTDVSDEIQAGPIDDPARTALASGNFQIVQVESQPEILAWDLGKGESAVLSYAWLNAGWTAIIDDLAARKCARSFAIPVKGTLALVILAKMRGLIGSASDVLQALRDAGLRLDDEVVRVSLKKSVNEDW
jgi:predicted nucleic acid-binding protein